MEPSDVTARLLQERHATTGRTGHKALSPDSELAGVHRMKAVNVLCRVNGDEDFLGVNMAGEGELNEYAVHRPVAVEHLDQSKQVSLRGARREAVLDRNHPHRFGLLELAGHVELARRILSDEHHRKAWGA